ncbi:hypothetical protein KJ632_01880, partial [Patescibacteria group bacterium]|nr:hypothetical protein [Patescibacteria group bacterium]
QDLIRMKEEDEIYASTLFDTVFPEIKDEFRRGGYEAIKDYWKTAIRVANFCGQKNEYLLLHYLFHEKENFKEHYKEYVDVLFKLNTMFKDIIYVARDLTVEKALDPKYVEICMQSESIGTTADFAYLTTVGELSEDEAGEALYSAPAVEIPNAEYRLKAKLKKTGKLTPVADQIISKCIEDYIWLLVGTMNDKHEKPKEERQKLINDFPVEGLYDLVVREAENISIPSFKEVIFPVLMRKMKEANMDAMEFVKHCDPEMKDLSILIHTFAKFTKLNPLLSTIRTQKKRDEFFKTLISVVNPEKDGLKDGLFIYQTMNVLMKGDLKYLPKMEKSLKDAYENSEGNRKLIYGIMASAHESFVKSEKDFFAELGKKYPMQKLSALEQKELVNKDNEVIQQYFFYNDGDGRESFDHMMSLYGAWEKEDHESFMILKKVIGDISILKYVNKPQAEDEGIDGIKKYLEDKDLSTIEIVHRGHSYHVRKTIERIPKSARIVFLGSCRGFSLIDNVIKKAPKAHIISTKATGLMTVNDPLLKLIDETIARGEGIEWDSLWEEAGKKLSTNSEWKYYVNPAKNSSVQFINVYNNHKIPDEEL